MRMVRILQKRGCFWVALVASLLLLLACGASLAFYVLFTPPPLNVLVVGLDARAGEGSVARTDAIVLIGVQTQRTRVGVLSVPRDLFVRVPSYGLQRVNTVNVLGEMEATGRGMSLLRDTFQQNFGVEVHRTLRMNFQGFASFVDALGGIEVDVPRLYVDNAFPTENYGTTTVRFEAGRQTLNGERALIYARMRNVDDDYARATRQQQIVQAIGVKLLNPLAWGGAWWALQSSIETDFTLGDAIRVFPTLVLNAGRYETLVIDRSLIRVGERGVEPNYPALQPYLEVYFR